MKKTITIRPFALSCFRPFALSRFRAFALSCFLLLALLPFGLFAQSYSGGAGTLADPYKIATRADMVSLATAVNVGGDYAFGKYFAMQNDIDMESTTFTPIGQYDGGKSFCGNFDGQGYKLINLNVGISGNVGSSGLFPYTINANISNLTIGSGSSVICSGHTGAFIGFMAGGSISRCVNNISITATSLAYNVGGFVGSGNGAATITNCAFKGSLAGTNTTDKIVYGGCFVGLANDFTSLLIKNCYNSGSISNSVEIGCGFVGLANNSTTTIENCYNSGTISAYWHGAAITYPAVTSAIRANCYYRTGSATNAGGGTVQSAATMTSAAFIATINGTPSANAFYEDNAPQINGGFPYLDADKPHYISFDNNGGTGTMNPIFIPFPYGTTVTTNLPLNSFTKANAAFDKWKDGSGVDYADGESVTTDNLTLYAQWVTAYDVTFNANNGIKPITGTMSTQGIIGGVATNLKTNAYAIYAHDFTGWNTNAGGTGTPYTNAQSVTLSANLDLFAQWSLNTLARVVTYGGDLKGNTIAFNKTYFLEGTELTLPIISATNFVFAGWYKDASITDGPHLTIPISETTPQTFYPKWNPEYTLTFDVNGLSAVANPASKVVVNDGVSTYGALATIDPMPVGFSLSWNTAIDGSGTTFRATDVVTIATNTTIYAILTKADWNIIKTRADLDQLATWVNNADPVYAAPGVYYFLGNDIDLGATPFTPIGNWFNHFKGVFYGNDFKISNLNITTGMGGLFGRTLNAEIHNLTIASGTISGTSYSGGIVGYMSGGLLTNCVNFANITNASDAAGGLVGNADNGATITQCVNNGAVTANVGLTGGIVGRFANGGTIKNCYNTANVGGNGIGGGIVGFPYNVNTYFENCYNTGMISATSSSWGITCPWGEEVATNCYYLTGSATYEGGGVVKSNTEMIAPAFVTTINNGQIPSVFSADLTPNINNGYPILSLLNTYRIEFDANGADGHMLAQIITRGDAVTLSLNTFTYGAAFIKWNTAANGSGDDYTDGQTFTPTSDLKLFAQWPLSYDVTFDANEGTKPYTGAMTLQKIIDGIPTNLKTNAFAIYAHDFAGWNTNAGGTGFPYTNGQLVTITANLNLFAQWSLNSLARAITYTDEKGFVIPFEKTYFLVGTELTLPVISATNFVFAGWYKDATFTDGPYLTISSTETAQQTFFAKWFEEYTLTFDANGLSGAVVPATKIVVNDGVSVYGALATINPMPIGYTLAWNTQADGNGITIKATDVVTITANTTLFAKTAIPAWNIITSRADLDNLASFVNSGNSTLGKYYILDNDIDMTGGNFTPIGTAANPFRGVFYGNGFKITNLHINSTLGGLFGCTENAQVHFVIVGTGVNHCTVSGTSETGALIGIMKGGIVSNCLNYATVSSLSAGVGGLVGRAENGAIIYNCANKGIIQGTAQVAGGIVGRVASSNCVVRNCYNNAPLSGTFEIASGIVGFSSDLPTIINCYNVGLISATGNGNSIASSWGTANVLNSYFLSGSATLNTFGTVKTETEMKDPAFVTTINAGQIPVVFNIDALNQNDGYPVLSLLNTYRINFNKNGGDGFMFDILVLKGGTAVLTPNEYTNAAAFFSGWNTQADGSGTSYSDGIIVTPTSDLTLYAQWEIAAVVTFHGNGNSSNYVSGTMLPQKMHLSTPTPLSINQYTSYNYNFLNWRINADGTGTSYGNSQIVSLTGNLSLYAQWSIKPRQAIVYNNLKTATIADSLKYYFPGTELILPLPITPGYNFAGWYKDATETDGPYTAIPSSETTPHTYYAKWVPKDDELIFRISKNNVTYEDITTLVPPNSMDWDFNPTDDYIVRTMQFFVNYKDIFVTKERTLTLVIPNGYKLLGYSALKAAPDINGLTKINMSSIDESKVSSIEVKPYSFPFVGPLATTWQDQTISNFTKRNSNVEEDVRLYCGEIKYTFNSDCDFISIRIQLGIQEDFFPHDFTTQSSQLQATSKSGSAILTQALTTNFNNVLTPSLITDFNYSNPLDRKKVSASAFKIENAIDVYSATAGIQEHYGDIVEYVIDYPPNCTFNGFTDRFLTYDYQSSSRYHEWATEAVGNVLEIKDATNTNVHLTVTDDPANHKVTFVYNKIWILRAEGTFQFITNWSSTDPIDTELDFLSSTRVFYHNKKWSPIKDVTSYVVISPDVIAFYARPLNITRLDLGTSYPYDYALGKFDFFNNGTVPPTDVTYNWEFGADLRVRSVSFPATNNLPSNNITDVVAITNLGNTINSPKVYALRYRNNNRYGIYVTADSLGLAPTEYIISLEAKQSSVEINRYDFPYNYSGGVYYGKFNPGGTDFSAKLTITAIGNTGNDLSDNREFTDKTIVLSSITDPNTQQFGAGETRLYNTDEFGFETNNYYYGDVIKFTAVNNAEKGYIIQDPSGLIVQNEVIDPTIVILLPFGLQLRESSVRAKSPSGILDGVEFPLVQQGTVQTITMLGVPWNVYKYKSPSTYDLIGRALNTLQPDIRNPITGDLESTNQLGADTVRFEVDMFVSTYAYPNLKMQDLVFWDYGIKAFNSTGGTNYTILDVYNVLGKGANYSVGSATQDHEISALLLPVLQINLANRTYHGAINSDPFLTYQGNNSDIPRVSMAHNAEMEQSYQNTTGGFFYPESEHYLPVPKKEYNFPFYFQKNSFVDPLHNLNIENTLTQFSMFLTAPIPMSTGYFVGHYGVGVRANSTQPTQPGGADYFAWKPVEILNENVGFTNGILNKWYTYDQVDVSTGTPTEIAAKRAILKEVNMVRFTAINPIPPGKGATVKYQYSIDEPSKFGMQNFWRIMSKGWVDDLGTGTWTLTEVIGAQTAKAGLQGIVFLDMDQTGKYGDFPGTTVNPPYTGSDIEIHLDGDDQYGTPILSVILPTDPATGRFSYDQPLDTGSYNVTVINHEVNAANPYLFTGITPPVRSFYTQAPDGTYTFNFNMDIKQTDILPDYSEATYEVSLLLPPEVLGIGFYPDLDYKIYYHNYKCADLSDTTIFPITYKTSDTPISIPDIACLDYTFLGWYSDPDYLYPSNTVPLGATGDKHFYALWDCPPKKLDAVNGDLYEVVKLANRCWYRTNLRAEVYQDNTTIPFAKLYECAGCPVVNDSIYGRLYTYEDVFNPLTSLPFNLCPPGWSLPTFAEWALLEPFAPESLRTNDWLNGFSNSNSTTFSMRPAGYWDGAANRFEKMFGYTRFWAFDSGSGGSLNSSTVLQFRYNCEYTETIEIRKGDAVSARCIMD